MKVFHDAILLIKARIESVRKSLNRRTLDQVADDLSLIEDFCDQQLGVEPKLDATVHFKADPFPWATGYATSRAGTTGATIPGFTTKAEASKDPLVKALYEAAESCRIAAAKIREGIDAAKAIGRDAKP